MNNHSTGDTVSLGLEQTLPTSQDFSTCTSVETTWRYTSQTKHSTLAFLSQAILYIAFMESRTVG